MNAFKPFFFACALLTLPTFLACGGGGGSDPAPVVAVSLAPTTASLTTGGTRSFVATVTGSSNTAVTWTVQEGTPGGTVSAAGLYTAPGTAGTFHVVATSVADASKSASAVVTVTLPIVTVSLNPASAMVQPSGTQSFTATVTGSSNTDVTWTISEGAVGGTVSGAGFYTAPATNGTYHVVATSVADASKSATATIVVAPIQVTISPLTVNLLQGGTQTFSAAVTGSSNTAVTWSIAEGASGGTMSGNLYTAPMTIGAYHVTATSVADPSKSSTATVTVAAVATGLVYTDPGTGSYRLLKDASSTGTHLVLNLVGPATGTAMGVALTLLNDAHTTWVDVPVGGTTTTLVANGTQFNLGAGTPILKAKVGAAFQATVAQKASTAPASLNGVLLQIALDLKPGQNLAQGATLVLAADATKCQVLDAAGGTISLMPLTVGTLTAQ